MLKFKLLQGILSNNNNNIRCEISQKALGEVKIINNKIRKWKRLNSFPIEFIKTEYPELLMSITHLKSGTGSAHTRVKVPEELNTDISYLLGAMRDGSLMNSSGKHWIRIYDSADSDWVENLIPIFRNSFEVVPKVRYQKKIREKYLDISSKPLYLMMNIMVDYSLHKGVPELINQAPIDIQRAYISGFFDAEGHVPSEHVKNKRCRITFTQKDETSLVFIKNILGKLGIKSSKISNYSFAIYGKEMVKMFYNNFRLLNRNKLERLDSMLRASRSQEATPGIDL